MELPTDKELKTREGCASYWAPAVICAAVLLTYLCRAAPQDSPHAAAPFPPRRPPPRAAPAGPSPSREVRLRTFDPQQADALAARLDRLWKLARGAVPNVAPGAFPPDMGRLPVDQKKRVFLRSVLPHVLAANRRVRRDRRRLLGIRKRLERGEGLTEAERQALEVLAGRYRAGDAAARLIRDEPAALCDLLLERADEIPPSLALAQAAIESAWGGSRFVREGNSLFGQWVFSADKGIPPRERPEGANYAVASFDHLGHAVEAYARNLNTFWAYEPFRKLRARMRARGEPLDPYRLAEGLWRYSERREAYVEEIRRVIRVNRLTRFDDVELVEVKAAG
ncbi:MAG: hypothetical protein Kow0092_09530 [Deferrisomatales bacterium]